MTNPSEAPRPPSRRGRVILLGGASLLILATVAAGAWNAYSQHLALRTAAEERRTYAPSVRVATVREGRADIVVRLPATTAAFTTANIFARASGYVDKRNVDIGDRVKAGDLLAAIVAPELDHQITQAQATLGQLKAAQKQQEANAELARVTWHRDRPLVKDGWVSAQQGTIDVQTLRAGEAAVGVAEANVAAQEAQLNVLNQQKLYQSVVAPFDGVITQRNIDIGSLVQADAVAGTFMFTIMQQNVIRTQLYVPQDAAVDVHPGVPAVVRVPEIPQHPFQGKVTRIADALQPGTRTLLVEIDIDNPTEELSPGIYCTVELHIRRTVPSLSIPAEALIFNSGGPQVAVVEQGAVRLRKITIARDFGTTLDVRDGLKPGDQVVLNPPVELVDGTPVTVHPPATNRS
jgi:RND family efflux transporter MFP subunit